VLVAQVRRPFARWIVSPGALDRACLRLLRRLACRLRVTAAPLAGSILRLTRGFRGALRLARGAVARVPFSCLPFCLPLPDCLGYCRFALPRCLPDCAFAPSSCARARLVPTRGTADADSWTMEVARFCRGPSAFGFCANALWFLLTRFRFASPSPPPAEPSRFAVLASVAACLRGLQFNARAPSRADGLATRARDALQRAITRAPNALTPCSAFGQRARRASPRLTRTERFLVARLRADAQRQDADCGQRP